MNNKEIEKLAEKLERCRKISLDEVNQDEVDEITDIKFRIYQTTVHSCRFLHTIYRGDEFETKHRIYRIWKYGTGHGRWNACEWNCKGRAAVCLCQAMG